MKKFLKISTYNIRNTTDNYEKRLPLLLNAIEKMDFDICGFQEVSFLQKNQILELMDGKLEHFEFFFGKSQMSIKEFYNNLDPFFCIDGNCMVANRNLASAIKYSDLHLCPVRIAQKLSFDLNFDENSNVRINVINIHLHHLPEENIIRNYQIKYIFNWVENHIQNNEIVFLIGDFNATPNSEMYKLTVEEGYSSSYYMKHGSEPEITFHNKMDAPFKDTDDPDTFDYIFFKCNDPKIKINVENIEIVGNEECEVHKGVWASDHFALAGQFLIEKLSD